MLRRDCDPTASETAALSAGSTLKASAIQLLAISMLSASSAVRVPSLREVERKSIIDSARRFFESPRDWECQNAVQDADMTAETYHIDKGGLCWRVTKDTSYKISMMFCPKKHQAGSKYTVLLIVDPPYSTLKLRDDPRPCRFKK